MKAKRDCEVIKFTMSKDEVKKLNEEIINLIVDEGVAVARLDILEGLFALTSMILENDLGKD